MLTPVALNQGNLYRYSITDSPNLPSGTMYAPGSNVITNKIYKRTGSGNDFLDTGEPSRGYWGCCATAGGNIYVSVSGGDIYMQTGGSGPFVALGQTSRTWRGMCENAAGDILACVDTGDIYKQTGGAGGFIGIGETTRVWQDICLHPSGDVYACVLIGDIYKQTGGVGSFAPLGQTSRGWYGIAADPITGDVYAVAENNYIYKQAGGVGNFIQITGSPTRPWRGIAVDLTGDIYAVCYNDDIYILKARLTYNTNGGGGTPPSDVDYKPGTEVTVASASGLSWYGHTFLEWNTAADGSGASYDPSDTFDIYDNTTLYAQWSVDPLEFHVEAVGSNTFPFDTRAKAAINFHELFDGLLDESVNQLYEGWTVYAYNTITEPTDEWDWFECDGADIIGEDPQTTIIDLDTSCFETAAIQNCTLFTDNPNAEWNTAIYDPYDVKRCKFDGNDLWYEAIEYWYTDRSIRIIGNSFENFLYYPIYIRENDLTSSNEVIIVNNSFDNPTAAVELYIRLLDCIVGKFYFYNNIGKRTVFLIELSSITINEFIHDYNISLEGYDYTEDSTPFSPAVTETTEDPLYLYTDPNNKLAIGLTSPAYHTGISRSDVPSIDLLGLPFADPPSRGAYEAIPPLIADFVGSPTSGDANLTVQFTDLSTGGEIDSWDWDFGDGSPHSTEQNPIHVYTTAEDYTVTLTVSDGVNFDSESKIDYISVNMLADFIVNNGIGDANLTVQFLDITLGNPDTWDWDFGDGSLHSSLQNPTHIYTLPGHFTVTLIASNSAKSDTIIKIDVITVYTNAEFEGSPLTGYNSLEVQFVDQSTGEPTSWYWSFGDGEFSEEQNPQHTYQSPGEYTVSLNAASSFNSDVETKVAYVIVSGTATPDIAPEPDISLYINGQANAYRNTTGIRIIYNKKE